MWTSGTWRIGTWLNGLWSGEAIDPPAVPPAPTFPAIGKRDLRAKRRAEALRTASRREDEFFMIGMP